MTGINVSVHLQGDSPTTPTSIGSFHFLAGTQVKQ